jgi:hypothetical protein
MASLVEHRRGWLGFLPVAVIVLAGGACGGGSGAAPCDDRTFLAQDEEVYVALATAQNAAASPEGPSVAEDLRRGADVLETRLDKVTPCDSDLRALAAKERKAVELLREAASALERGEPARVGLAEATAILAETEITLRKRV